MTASTIPATDASYHRPTGIDGSQLSAEYGLTVHAVLPPPVTGMALCTESVANAAARRVSVRRYNWSNGSPKLTSWFRFVKALRALTTPVRLLIGSRPRHGVFYMPSNAGLAVIFNLLALGAARLRGYRCVLHHHYYRYVDNFEWRIKLVTCVLGPNDLQIVLCPAMERRFRALYGPTLPLAVMPSTIQLLQGEAPRPLHPPEPTHDVGPFCLGHISNLQIAKGLDLVLDVFRELRCQQRDVRLVLAGPIDTDVERRMIEAAQAEFGERLDYRGPVYGEAKQRFFQDIHVEVFPTRLDAMPLVIAEAFAFAKPVISFGRGCIPALMPASNWWIAVTDDFVDGAVRQVGMWIDDRQAYADACRLARQRYDDLLAEARDALNKFVRWVCCEAADDFVRCGPTN
jgi:glycosyltransferase involved in cell wall biosynthesis